MFIHDQMFQTTWDHSPEFHDAWMIWNWCDQTPQEVHDAFHLFMAA